MAYVYIHYRKDNGKPFYVGKGNNKRAWVKGGRPKEWSIVAENCGYDVSIVKDNLTEDEAFELEKQTISEIGLENLTNTDGGGSGPSIGMFKHTEEAKRKIKEASRGRRPAYGKAKMYIELTTSYIGTLTDMAKRFSIKHPSNFNKYLGKPIISNKSPLKGLHFQIYQEK